LPNSLVHRGRMARGDTSRRSVGSGRRRLAILDIAGRSADVGCRRLCMQRFGGSWKRSTGRSIPTIFRHRRDPVGLCRLGIEGMPRRLKSCSAAASIPPPSCI
jgi:hypothetical protein